MTPFKRPVSAEERAAMILDAISLETEKYFVRGIISKQIELASQEAYSRGFNDANVKAVSLEYVETIKLEAYQRGLKEGDSCTTKSMEIAREAGWNEAIEKCAKVALPHHGCAYPGCTDECKEAHAISSDIRNLKSEGKG